MSKAKILLNNSIEAVFRELHMLRKFNSNMIHKVHYAFQDDQNLYQVMELLDGGQLR